MSARDAARRKQRPLRNLKRDHRLNADGPQKTDAQSVLNNNRRPHRPFVKHRALHQTSAAEMRATRNRNARRNQFSNSDRKRNV